MKFSADLLTSDFPRSKRIFQLVLEIFGSATLAMGLRRPSTGVGIKNLVVSISSVGLKVAQILTCSGLVKIHF